MVLTALSNAVLALRATFDWIPDSSDLAASPVVCWGYSDDREVSEMSSKNPWSVQAIIERIDSERRQALEATRAEVITVDLRSRRVPRPRRSLLAILRSALFGCETAVFGGRHALR
ncbi:hypothetical protein [Nocardia sp. NPDC050406]|uniref:hypothetical protein n=1 Tax=Nocardia sp. NPDC050406 TaxID=3364318 RepID=UPI003798F8E8